MAAAKEYKAGLGGIQLGRTKISTGFIIGGVAVLAFIYMMATKAEATPSGGGGGVSGAGGGVRPGDDTEIIPQPTVPLYSVINGAIARCKPYAWNAATDAQWRTVASLCEGKFKNGQYYRGNGKYVANFSGDIIPEYGKFNGLLALAKWIQSGGVYIDYCSYPMNHFDCQLWLFNSAYTYPLAFCGFVGDFGIPEFPGSFASVDFNARKTYLGFPYPNSFTLRTKMPSRSVFLTSDLLYPNSKVPFVPSKIYSMCALRIGKGIYAYSNVQNNATDYANFLIAVHNYAI